MPEFDASDMESVQQAVLDSKNVPRDVLEQYTDETWAVEAIGKLPEPKWWDQYGVKDDKWLSVVGRYGTGRDALDALVELNKLKSGAISPPSKDLKSDEYDTKVSEMRRKVVGIEKAEDYVVNIPDDMKDEVQKRSPTFEKDVRNTAFQYARTQAEVDKGVEEAMTKLRETIETEKKGENEANASKVRNRQEIELIWGKRTDQELENARLLLRHYDNSLLFTENQSLFTEEVRAERGGYLEQFLSEHNDPKFQRFLASLHKPILGEGGFVDGTLTVGKDNRYTDRYEQAQKSWPKRGEAFWDDIAKSNIAI